MRGGRVVERRRVVVTSWVCSLTLILPNLVVVNIFVSCLYILFIFVYRWYILKIRAFFYLIW